MAYDEEKKAFIEAFVAHVVRWTSRPVFEDGSSVEDYARETALSYFEEQHKQGLSAEECADADMSYWGS